MFRKPGSGGRQFAPIAQLQAVSKVYQTPDGPLRVLHKVDLELHEGEMVALIGASGSGKSTCANIIGCLDQPSSGRCLIAGRDVSRADAHERALIRRELLGFVFQSFNLLPRLTALENVMLPLTYKGLPLQDRRRLACAAIASVGLDGLGDRLPSMLSGGQQQRVAIARALAARPRLIVADEPTAALDQRTGDDLLALLRLLVVRGRISVLIITHDPDVARQAERVLEMVGGQLTARNDVRESA